MMLRAGPLRPLLFLLLALIPGVFACTSAGDRDQPGTTGPVPPGADVSTGTAAIPGAFFGTPSGVAGRMIEGTRCWGNACVDMVGPITLADPQLIPGGEPIDITFEGASPSEVTVTWVDVGGVAPLPLQDGLLAWTGGTGGSPAVQGGKTVSPARSGDYVLTVFAKWPGGDIVFSTYFRVV